MFVEMCNQVTLPYHYLIMKCFTENSSQIGATQSLGPQLLKLLCAAESLRELVQMNSPGLHPRYSNSV